VDKKRGTCSQASRRAPPVLSCLDALFEHQRDGVPFDTAVQAVANMLAAHANQRKFQAKSASSAFISIVSSY